MDSACLGPRPRMNRTFIFYGKAHFSIRKPNRMMKQEDARGAHTGSCEFGDGGARHYGICGHLRPQSKCIVLTTLVDDRKICILELNFFLFKKKS